MQGVRIAIIGLGYVGLPLAVEFGKHYPSTGFDIDRRRIAELLGGIDVTMEVEPELLANSGNLSFSGNPEDIRDCNIYIVTVPTPIDDFKTPDLQPLRSASELVGGVLQCGDIVIYESTVYPGATEEVCVPILESVSGMVFNQDFFVGYSPERINPGDKSHRVANILKVTSGSTPETAERVDRLYASITAAGTHRVSCIRVAEAAKVIENIQRDVNIALINELSILFEKLGIDTLEVLEAAGTKWNFLPFRPGLVGGHCIGVDPYYLTHKAQSVNYHPDIILAGRRINDGMGAYVADRVIRLMTQRKIAVADSTVLILGLTFKENCPDIRNTRVIDVVKRFASYDANVEVYDPWASPAETEQKYGIRLQASLAAKKYDAIVLAVGHQLFRDMGLERIRALGRNQHVLFDVKYLLPKEGVDGRL
jgi:UDP-N-acetyl-D-galactosamine dehydrogenase